MQPRQWRGRRRPFSFQRACCCVMHVCRHPARVPARSPRSHVEPAVCRHRATCHNQGLQARQVCVAVQAIPARKHGQAAIDPAARNTEQEQRASAKQGALPGLRIIAASPNEYWPAAELHCDVFYPGGSGLEGLLQILDRVLALQATNVMVQRGVGK